MKLTLRKVQPKLTRKDQPGMDVQRTSAAWLIEELPGLLVAQFHLDRDTIGVYGREGVSASGWAIFPEPDTMELYRMGHAALHGHNIESHLVFSGQQLLACQIASRLEGQVFATRRETLQAIEAAALVAQTSGKVVERL